MPKAPVQASPALRQVSNLNDIANAIRDEAVAAAYRTRRGRARNTSRTGVLQQPDCFRRFSLGLGAGLARVLAANDERVVAVYGYQPTRPTASEQRPQLSPAIAIHLLIIVTAPSAALQAFVASLSRALAASLRALPAFQRLGCDPVVDANVITEHEQRLGLGLAGLLSAVPAPSVKLWGREAEG